MSAHELATMEGCVAGASKDGRVHAEPPRVPLFTHAAAGARGVGEARGTAPGLTAPGARRKRLARITSGAAGVGGFPDALGETGSPAAIPTLAAHQPGSPLKPRRLSVDPPVFDTGCGSGPSGVNVAPGYRRMGGAASVGASTRSPHSPRRHGERFGSRARSVEGDHGGQRRPPRASGRPRRNSTDMVYATDAAGNLGFGPDAIEADHPWYHDDRSMAPSVATFDSADDLDAEAQHSLAQGIGATSIGGASYMSGFTRQSGVTAAPPGRTLSAGEDDRSVWGAGHASKSACPSNPSRRPGRPPSLSSLVTDAVERAPAREEPGAGRAAATMAANEACSTRDIISLDDSGNVVLPDIENSGAAGPARREAGIPPLNWHDQQNKRESIRDEINKSTNSARGDSTRRGSVDVLDADGEHVGPRFAVGWSGWASDQKSTRTDNSSISAGTGGGRKMTFRVDVNLGLDVGFDDVTDRHVKDLPRGKSGRSVASSHRSHRSGLAAASWASMGSHLAKSGNCVGAALRLVWQVLFPGTLRSRFIYEQLRMLPILLAWLMMVVPMDKGGGVLDVWSYALVFQSVYFLTACGFAFATFGLLYALPPWRRTLIFVIIVTVAHALMLLASLKYLSGRELFFALPAAIVVLSLVTFAYMGYAAVEACVVAVVSTGQARNRRSVCDLITGRVPVHTQAKPAVDMSSLSGRTSVRRRPRSPMDRRVPSFVLNAQALLPFRRLLLSLTLLLAAYYWFQVYTTTVSSDINAFLGEGSNYTFLTVLIYDIAFLMFRQAMRAAVARDALTRVGIPEESAQGLFIVMTYAVTLLGDFYQRLLFLKFTTLSSVIIAVVQRSALSLLTGPVLMSHWSYNLRNRIKSWVCKRVYNKEASQVTHSSFKAFLFDHASMHCFGHIANFTSLVAWLAAMLWMRLGYNAGVYPLSSDAMTDRQFWVALQYGGLFALGELVELGVLRSIVKGYRLRKCFDKIMGQLRLPHARAAFILVAGHVLQDALVALLKVEPNSFHVHA